MRHAPNLAHADIAVVDRSPLRRLGWGLLGAVAVMGAEAALIPPMSQAQTVQSATEGASPATTSRLTTADIETAEYHGGDLPAGQSAITAKVQILLDRSGISPGVVDGWRGGMSESAIMAFQRRAGLPMDGRMNPVVWQLLQPFAAEPLTMTYTIAEQDAYGLVDNIPADYGEKAKMTSQGYTSIEEKLAERFHMDEKFLVKLNPGVAFVPGATIHATVPAKPIRRKVARIVIDKATRRVAAYDDRGRMVADYPATVGSDQTPSPHGTHTVDAVALDPVYTYNPNRNFKQGDNDRVLTIPPGPNGPVGNVWIDLSQPTYGIHGTATPSKLFVNQSNGCVRLTNWDARELAGMVQPGTTVVEFLAPGVSIADVTGAAAPAATGPAAVATSVVSLGATRPKARPRIIEMATLPEAPLPAVTQPPMAEATADKAQGQTDVSQVGASQTSQSQTSVQQAGTVPESPPQTADQTMPTVPATGPDPLASALAQAVGPAGVPAKGAAEQTPSPSSVEPVTTSTLPQTPAAAPDPQTTPPQATLPPAALSPTAPPRRRARTEAMPAEASSEAGQ